MTKFKLYTITALIAGALALPAIANATSGGGTASTGSGGTTVGGRGSVGGSTVGSGTGSVGGSTIGSTGRGTPSSGTPGSSLGTVGNTPIGEVGNTAPTGGVNGSVGRSVTSSGTLQDSTVGGTAATETDTRFRASGPVDSNNDGTISETERSRADYRARMNDRTNTTQ